MSTLCHPIPRLKTPIDVEKGMYMPLVDAYRYDGLYPNTIQYLVDHHFPRKDKHFGVLDVAIEIC